MDVLRCKSISRMTLWTIIANKIETDIQTTERLAQTLNGMYFSAKECYATTAVMETGR